MKQLIIIFLFLISTSNFLNAQSQFLPVLSKQEMYADFDTLYKTISLVNPHEFVRKNINKYAMLDSIKILRKNIEYICNTADFYWLVNKALTFCQDEHTSVVNKRFYPFIDSLDKVRLKSNISDTTFINAYSNLRRSRLNNINLNIPIKYIDGEYKVLQTFKLKGVNIEQGAILTLFNKQPIPNYLKNHLGDIEAMHWDFERQVFYKDNFYQGNHIDLNEVNTFTFFHKRKIINLKCRLTDTVQYQKNENISVENQDLKPFISYFINERILYIRMPEMSNQNFYIKQLDSLKKIVNVNEISKIIWDIRGNAGGDDGVWINVLLRLLDKPILRKIILGCNANNPYTHRFNENVLTPFKNDFIKQGYIQFSFSTDTMNIFEDSWHYKGKIYILQDEYCFSSAGSLISMCQFSDRLINVGNSTGRFAGFGVMPWVYILPNSKILYWIEPVLDFTNVNKTEDFFHNFIKLPVKKSFQNFVEQYKNKGQLYNKNYLTNKDLVFRVALSQH